MRRSALGCVVTVLLAALGAGPATAVPPAPEPFLQLNVGRGLFVSQNGDGVWETTTSRVLLDPTLPVAARWRIVASGVTVAGPYEFTSAELEAGRRQRAGWAYREGAEISIDPRARLGHPLAAGLYQWEVETTAIVDGVSRTARAGSPLVVSNAAPVISLPAPWSSVFYPEAVDASDRVPRLPAIDTSFDPWELTYGGIGYRILDVDGEPAFDRSYGLHHNSLSIVWSGVHDAGENGAPAPEGTYRIELVRHPNCPFPNGVAGVTAVASCDPVYGPVSEPFTVRHGFPDVVDVVTSMTAGATHRRTRRQEGSTMTVDKRGVMRFASLPTAARPGRVTTSHAVVLPRDRIQAFSLTGQHPEKRRRMVVRLKGAWGPDHRRIRIHVAPRFEDPVRVDPLLSSAKAIAFRVPDEWISPTGVLRFSIRWKGRKPLRFTKLVVDYNRYQW